MDRDAEVPRLARLARLEIADPVALARACAGILRDFSDLAAYAATLPPAPPEAPGELRADEPRPAPADEVAGILAAARVDPTTGAVIASRGRG